MNSLTTIEICKNEENELRKLARFKFWLTNKIHVHAKTIFETRGELFGEILKPGGKFKKTHSSHILNNKALHKKSKCY